MRCPNCGKEVQDGFVVCPDCSEMLPINDDTNNYNSDTYTSSSYADIGNNYNSKSPKKLKLYILIILVVFSAIVYSAITKNGTYEYKGDGEIITLKIGMNKCTLTEKIETEDYEFRMVCHGKVDFDGSTGTLTINEGKASNGKTEVSLNETFKNFNDKIECKYNRFKKTITIDLNWQKYTLKKKWWFG
ncbi:MAG: zinc ribbon domain-containing protein [Lachnospiraceae bacterium]|nr:zinc ribbon domain-containing protein [Lachnospiraceae bacterium]